MTRLWEHLIDRPAHYQPCPRCGRHTLTAYASGIKIRLDPQTLNSRQELAALLSGRRTYDLMVWGLPRRMHPVWRDMTRILKRQHQVVATHQCPPGAKPVAAQPEIEISVPVPKPPDTDQPQF